MTRIAVFAYASLVDPASASLTLGREVPQPRPARLAGWRRRWSQARDNLREEKTFAIEPDGRLPPWVLGLNIEPSDAGPDEDGPNGALLEVSEGEIERLDLRELRYDRTEVTSQIDAADGFDVVFAYKAKSDHFAPEPPPGAVILATYARAVERAFAALGDGQHETYLRTTGTPPVELVEGRLVRDRIPPGNPRAW
jgi:hypothetical protein